MVHHPSIKIFVCGLQIVRHFLLAKDRLICFSEQTAPIRLIQLLTPKDLSVLIARLKQAEMLEIDILSKLNLHMLQLFAFKLRIPD